MTSAAVIERIDASTWVFWCPGCRASHPFDTRWTMTGNEVRPTFKPSLLVNAPWPDKRCHLFITDGRIEFQPDCFHELKGQVVRMQPVDAFTGEPRS